MSTPECLLYRNVYSHNVYCAKMSIPIKSTVATVQDAQACLSNLYHINPLPASDGSMTFGRKIFRRNDVWLNATFGRYDFSPTTTFGRLRHLVENLSNNVEILVEIWSKCDLYRKNKNCLHLRFSHLQYIFKPVSVFRVLKALICHLLGPPIASEK